MKGKKQNVSIEKTDWYFIFNGSPIKINCNYARLHSI